MEGNKDEALRCLLLAKNSLKLGDHSKALRFAEKSKRLYPTLQSQEFLLTLKRKETLKDTENINRKYSKDQHKAVKEVLASKSNYYKVLAIEKTANNLEIKKAYRKKALLFHPDKNSAPGADEAFKLVAEAFQVLSDSNKRAIHDEERPKRYTRNDFSNAFYEQRQHRTQRYRSEYVRRERQYQQMDFGFVEYFPFMMIILVLLLSLLLSVEKEPLFTFEATAANTQERDTMKNNIRYFVNPKVFTNKIGNSKYRLVHAENQIEIDWAGKLRRQCLNEKRKQSCWDYELLVKNL